MLIWGVEASDCYVAGSSRGAWLGLRPTGIGRQPGEDTQARSKRENCPGRLPSVDLGRRAAVAGAVWAGRGRNLRESLERLDGDATAHRSPLFRGLEPYPNGWRAA